MLVAQELIDTILAASNARIAILLRNEYAKQRILNQCNRVTLFPLNYNRIVWLDFANICMLTGGDKILTGRGLYREYPPMATHK